MRHLKLSKCKFYAACVLAVVVVFSASCTDGRTASTSEKDPGMFLADAVDINSASAEELARINHIGPKLAHAIVDFRERHGRFRRPENLMLIRGISDGRFRQIRAFVKTE